MSEENEGTMVFQDPVHGPIELIPVCTKIIDTPYFQRLRFIKQLGPTSFVYPGAVHTRFEHSIGTCYLAATMVRGLMGRQKELNISQDDLKCVSVAALCHDLGHGPFSHLFDRSFLPSFHPGWKHEQASIMMLEHMRGEEEGVREFLSDQDMDFIRELILPTPSCKARGSDKQFLYEIVSNSRTGIDVDKWDYFSRDCLYLGLKSSFDSQRLMKFVRVKTVAGVRQLCYRDKLSETVVEMFRCRRRLFETAYFHKTTLVIEHMINRAFVEANDHLKFTGKHGQLYKLSDCVNDMEAYSSLTDDLLMRIYHSHEPDLQKARMIVERIFRRQLPKCIGKVDAASICLDEEGLKEDLLKTPGVTKEDVIVLRRTLDWGLEEPLKQCYFFSKESSEVPCTIQCSDVAMEMGTGKKTHFLIYSNFPERRQLLRRSYEHFCCQHGLHCSKGTEKGGHHLTPSKESVKRRREEL